MTGLFVRFYCSTAILATAIALHAPAAAQQDDTATAPPSAALPQPEEAATTAEPTGTSPTADAGPATATSPTTDAGPTSDTGTPSEPAATPGKQDAAGDQDTVAPPADAPRFQGGFGGGEGRGFRSRGFGRPGDESRFAAPETDSAPSPSDQPAAGPAAAPRPAVGPTTPSRSAGPSDSPANSGLVNRSLENNELVFNFAGADWRMTLDWLAEQANLSLQVDRYPSGTVNYIDNSRTYTVAEAMDVLNRLLMDKGFALVRRDRSLMLIDLEADNAAALISEIAELVTPDELDKRANSDIVRCVFSLGSLSAEAARTEITQLIGPAGRVVVLDSTRQVVVSETVGRLKAIRTLLANAARASSDVTEIVLQHRVADELLEIARPLIGLEPGANSNDKIRIAVGLYGDRLWATGDPSTRALLEGIIERADTPLQVAATESGSETSLPRLETYSISTAGSSTVIDVLQTLLAGVPDTRIALDPQTGGLIAYARPETHQLIQQTIDKLEGRGSTFEIIQLRRLEPSQALLTINKFFGATTEAGKKDAPTVDGDPVTGRLWVRGTPEQIQLVKGLIERLEGADGIGANDRVRVLPYTGRSAEETIEQLQQLWNVIGRKNRIRMVAPASGGSTSTGNSFPQRRVGGLAPTPPRATDGERSQPLEYPASAPETDREEKLDRVREEDAAAQEALHRRQNAPVERKPQEMTLVSETAADIRSPFANLTTSADEPETRPTTPDGSGDIVITMTPGGMVVASDDPIALSDFEQMMRTLNEQTAQAGAQPTVFWLKYAKAPEAADLVTRILGGGDSGGGGGGNIASSVLNELGGGMLGGLLGLGGGSSSSSSGPILTTTGSVSIVADGRLNALIVQANAIDMLTIEMILEVIDREESPEDVRTTSKPQLIPVIYQNANDVATIVKAVYAERSSEQGGGRQQQQMSPQDLINALRSAGGGGGGGRGGRGGGSEQTTKPAPVSIAVDARSNSLIVTAPPQDVEDIRELVEAIDAGGMQSEETVEIIALQGNVKPQVVQQALNSVLGTQARSTTSTSNNSGSNNNSGGGNSPSASDIQRRMEFLQQMQQRGGFGGGTPGGGGAPGGFGGGGATGGFRGGAPTGGRGGGAPSGRGGGSTGRGGR